MNDTQLEKFYKLIPFSSPAFSIFSRLSQINTILLKKNLNIEEFYLACLDKNPFPALVALKTIKDKINPDSYSNIISYLNNVDYYTFARVTSSDPAIMRNIRYVASCFTSAVVAEEDEIAVNILKTLYTSNLSAESPIWDIFFSTIWKKFATSGLLTTQQLIHIHTLFINNLSRRVLDADTISRSDAITTDKIQSEELNEVIKIAFQKQFFEYALTIFNRFPGFQFENSTTFLKGFFKTIKLENKIIQIMILTEKIFERAGETISDKIKYINLWEESFFSVNSQIVETYRPLIEMYALCSRIIIDPLNASEFIREYNYKPTTRTSFKKAIREIQYRTFQSLFQYNPSATEDLIKVLNKNNIYRYRPLHDHIFLFKKDSLVYDDVSPADDYMVSEMINTISDTATSVYIYMNSSLRSSYPFYKFAFNFVRDKERFIKEIKKYEMYGELSIRNQSRFNIFSILDYNAMVKYQSFPKDLVPGETMRIKIIDAHFDFKDKKIYFDAQLKKSNRSKKFLIHTPRTYITYQQDNEFEIKFNKIPRSQKFDKLFDALINNQISVSKFEDLFYFYHLGINFQQDLDSQIKYQFKWFKAFATHAKYEKSFQKLQTIYADPRDKTIFDYSHRFVPKNLFALFNTINKNHDKIQSIIENFEKICNFDYDITTKLFIYYSTIIKFVYPFDKFLTKFCYVQQPIIFKEFCSMSIPFDLLYVKSEDGLVTCKQSDTLNELVISQLENKRYEFNNQVCYVKLKSFDPIKNQFVGVFFFPNDRRFTQELNEIRANYR